MDRNTDRKRSRRREGVGEILEELEGGKGKGRNDVNMGLRYEILKIMIKILKTV